MSKFKVGDNVYFVGKVSDINEYSDYPVRVDFVGQEAMFSFTGDGRYWKDSKDIILKKIEKEDSEITRLMNALHSIKEHALSKMADEYGSDGLSDIWKLAKEALDYDPKA